RAGWRGRSDAEGGPVRHRRALRGQRVGRADRHGPPDRSDRRRPARRDHPPVARRGWGAAARGRPPRPRPHGRRRGGLLRPPARQGLSEPAAAFERAAAFRIWIARFSRRTVPMRLLVPTAAALLLAASAASAAPAAPPAGPP